MGNDRLDEDRLLADAALRAWEAAAAAGQKKEYDDHYRWQQNVKPSLEEFCDVAAKIQDEQLLFDLLERIENSPLVNHDRFGETGNHCLYLLADKIQDPDMGVRIIVNTHKIDREWKFDYIVRGAIYKIKDQEILKKIAEPSNLELYGTCAATTAIREIEDQEFLVRIAKTHPYFETRSAAVEKISGEDDLIDIMRSDDDESVRKSIAERLTDQKALADTAIHDEDPYVRAVAIERLDDPSVLEFIAVHDSEPEVRIAAVEKITDQKVLEAIALNDDYPIVRSTAMELILDDNVIEKLVLREKVEVNRNLFIWRIKTRETLAKIAQEDDYYENRMIAAAICCGIEPSEFMFIREIEEQLLAITDDIRLIEDIALNTNYPETIKRALDMLPDSDSKTVAERRLFSIQAELDAPRYGDN